MTSEPSSRLVGPDGLDELSRVALDMHDSVVQRLFGTGLGLQAVLREMDDPALADRLARHIADLDDTINQIRIRVFGYPAA